MAGTYYDPQMHNAFGNIIPDAMKTYAGLQQIEKSATESKMLGIKAKEMEREEAARGDVETATKANQERLAAIQDPEKPVAGAWEILPGAEKHLNMSVMDSRFQGPLGKQAVAEANAKVMAEHDNVVKENTAKRSVSQGQLYNDYMTSFEKHGLIEKSLALRKGYYDHIKDLMLLSPEAAMAVAQAGPDAKILKGITADALRKGEYEMKTNKDGYTILNKKTGVERFVRTSQPGETDKMGGNTGLRGFDENGYHVTEEYNKDTKKWEFKSKNRLKDPNTSGAGKEKEEKWTISKVRSEYGALSANVNTQIKDLEKQLEDTPDDYKAKDKLTELRDARNKLNTYRSYDEDWVKKGQDPKNLYKVGDFISGFGGGAASAGKEDITKEKPSVKAPGGKPPVPGTTTDPKANPYDGNVHLLNDGKTEIKFNAEKGVFQTRGRGQDPKAGGGSNPAQQSSAPATPAQQAAQQAVAQNASRSSVVASNIGANRPKSVLENMTPQDWAAIVAKEGGAGITGHNMAPVNVGEAGRQLSNWAGGPVRRVLSDAEHQKLMSKR